MAVNRTPVLKRCRSLDLDPTYLGIDKKSKRTLKRSNRKMSEYGSQLREKQRAKFIYGILEGQTGENLMVLLETRLDNILFRCGWARTRKEARQMVDHKFVTVNGSRVNIPSYEVKVGDVVEIREGRKTSDRMKQILDATNGRVVPEWLDSNSETLKATVVALPKREQIDVPVNEMQIVELYSK